ncbi:hypothetical protein HUJ04_000677 [Dendroctonus ponderosae]|nr:hypothetical protein HUJ04_000677 [Dendroctonus ponderosae]KAH1018830.1 hypothetical protein HUJ05_006522 [Dendroctonus ponderosae]
MYSKITIREIVWFASITYPYNFGSIGREADAMNPSSASRTVNVLSHQLPQRHFYAPWSWLRNMSGDSNHIDSLITQYRATELNVNKLQQIYDKLEEGLLQDSLHLQNSPSAVKNGTTQSKSSLVSLKTCKNKPLLKNKSSTSGVSVNRSSNGDEKLNISKAVERRIHQIENCKNVLRQAKAIDEKVFILDSLSNNDVQ